MRIVMRTFSWVVISMLVAATAAAADLPAWVTRGSVAANNAGDRAFYGVGSASGIKNPPLLRSTADNRARNELAKVFETFSASLMKDYMNSDGGQSVEQAVKTVTSMSLEGVDIRDRYIAGDGTMYSLAVLDLEKVLPAIQKAKESGLVKSSVTPVTVDDIFDQHGQKVEQPKTVVASGGEAAAETKAPPKSTTSETKTQKGGKPAWIDGEDQRFPFKQYLCAVGYGPKREIAESGAYAALAKVFVVHVEQASKDFMGAYSQTGAPSLEVQSSEVLTKTSTEKLLTAVRIPEVWEDKDATTFALSCIERAKNSKMLGDQIAELDGKAEAAIKRAEGADAQTKLKELTRALDTLQLREALNNELRIVDFDGIGISSPYAQYDVAAAMEATQQAMRVAVIAEGPFADDFRNAIIASLTSANYTIEEVENGDTKGFDVVVKAKIRIEDGGAGTGTAANLHFARGVVLLEVKNAAKGRTIGSFNESRKEGHRSMEEAQRRAVRELAKKLAGPVGKKIDDALKGRS